RTKEIGILKAIGATEEDIRNIFLFESGVLGMVGGIAGSALAIALVYVGGLFGLPAQINIWIAFFGTAFAFVVGVLSGYFPAMQAARLAPVEALRYE
ncbi:MAG: FtsX-like permease family protein, partial [Candidatus Micrarchaeota archaeon]|nr:FtsX-like permease family protein [Candidatus Micrarchaeota archaeon]